MVATKFWAAARNAALKVVAFWVLAFAAYLALGRQFFPYIEKIEPEIEQWLSGQLGATVEIGQLHGRWERFNPVLYLRDVQIGETLSVSEMTLAPGIYESFSRRGLSFIRFELRDFNADLYETEQGWQIRGLATPNTNPEGFNLETFVQLVSRQQEVQFRDARLNVLPLRAPNFSLLLNSGRLTGYEDENFLLANATISGGGLDVPVELQIETSQSDPDRNRAYISHGAIDLSPWLRSSIPELSQATVAGEYWLDLYGNHWQQLTSRLDIQELAIGTDLHTITLSDTHLESFISVLEEGVEGWFDVQKMTLNERSYPSARIGFTQKDRAVNVRWDRLPATIVGQWFALTDPTPFWTSLDPRGWLDDGIISFELNTAGSLRASASMSDLSIRSYGSIPGLTNLQGALQMAGAQGTLTFTSEQTEFTLPQLFDAPYQAVVEQASMQWFRSADSGLLAQGDGDVVLRIDSPFVDSNTPLPIHVDWQSVALSPEQMATGRQGYAELQLTIADLEAQWAKQLTANKLVPQGAIDVVTEGLDAAVFTDIEFNYLTSVNAQRERFNQMFLNASLSQGRFYFLEDWLAAEELSGDFALTSDGVTLTADSGYYPGFNLQNGRLRLDFESDLLTLDVRADSTAEASVDFLKTGPLRSLWGETLDDWYAYGEINTRLQIALPLSEPGGMTVAARANVANTELELVDLDLRFSDVNGTIQYTTERGLFANNLTLSHQLQPQTVSISSVLSADFPVFTIDADGVTPVAYWGARFDDAFLALQTAVIPHKTTVTIDPEKVRIQARSPMTGLALDFPQPLTKQTDDVWLTDLDVVMDQRNWMTIRVNADDRLLSFFEMNERNEIQRGTVAYQTPLNVRADNGVYFDISAREADGDDWWQAIQQTRQLYADDTPPEPGFVSFEELIAQINISAEAIDYLAQPWTAAQVSLLRNEEAWLVDFSANEGRGQVFVPHDDSPLFAEVEWVELETGEEDVPLNEQVDLLAAYLPSDVPNMSVQINKLILNELDMGSWRAEIAVVPEQLQVSNILGQMLGANVTGELNWNVKNGKHETSFKGNVALANIYDFLTAMNYAPVLTSRDGSIDIDASWKGSPAFFDFRRIKGKVDLNLNKGSILNAEEYEGVKLIGLLNFTKVLQRLVLDFSDLLASGIGFDYIEGELLFDRGFARVGEQLIIDGSATKFRFNGDADLLSDELDIDMVLTVPLSSTFPLVALLAGVSPQAAAAIYVTERVFNDQLESLSSARMHITGSFENPNTRFYRPTEAVNATDDANPQ